MAGTFDDKIPALASHSACSVPVYSLDIMFCRPCPRVAVYFGRRAASARQRKGIGHFEQLAGPPAGAAGTFDTFTSFDSTAGVGE